MTADNDPIRVISTERLMAELARRAKAHVLIVLEEAPRFSWGSKSNQAHETLGLAQQAIDAIAIEARSQLRFGTKTVEQHFADRAAQSTLQPLTYEYIPPGKPPANPGTPP